jgi:hypothetical protein
MTSGYSNLPHRNAKAALSCDFFGAFVPRVNVTHDARAGVVDQHTRYLFGGEVGSIDDEHLPTMNRTTDADTTAVVE